MEYLRGRFFWNKRTAEDIKRAIAQYSNAVAKDPQYALGHVGLAESYLVLGVYNGIPLREAYQKAKTAVLKALEIDDTLGEAHASLALVKAGEWDLRAALREFSHAIALNPNYATAHQWFAEHLICAGHIAEALAESRRALELEPFSLSANTSAGLTLLQARDCDSAIAQLQRTIEMDKNFHVAHRVLRDAYLEKHMYEDAIAEHELASVLAGGNAKEAKSQSKALWQAWTQAGALAYWQQRLTFALQNLSRASALPYDLGDTSPYHLAVICARLGQEQQAVSYLQRALDNYDYGIFYIKTNPVFDALHSDPVVQAIMRRIGVES